MARLESVALGGYYKTPTRLLDMMSSLVAHDRGDGGAAILCDPCCGEGEAIKAFRNQFGYQPGWGAYQPGSIHACELEKDRYQTSGLEFRGGRSKIWNGDAFNIFWTIPEASFLYLNPPYDTDRDYKRLEHRFLVRFTSYLLPGGALFYVVPDYVLRTSAEFLAANYTDLHCFRFPDPEFQDYKQVVLLGVRREREVHALRSEISMIEEWSRECPVLTRRSSPLVTVRTRAQYSGDVQWVLKPIDRRKLQEDFKPWTRGSKQTPERNLGFDSDLSDLFAVSYDTVMPPKPAHVAVALASGMINGIEVSPDDPEAGLPRIIVKGVFNRELKVIEEKQNKEGEITKLVSIQSPKLKVTVLNMDTWAYHDLRDGAEPTGDTSFEGMTTADLLHWYGRSLAALMDQQCSPLHREAGVLELPEFGLTPYKAQRRCIEAGLLSIFSPEKGSNLFLLGEVGTGKTLITMCTIDCLSRKNLSKIRGQIEGYKRVRPVDRVLVVCPPHLLTTWEEELAKILPSAVFYPMSSIADVEAARHVEPKDDGKPGSGLVFMVMSREMAKLGSAVEGAIYKKMCPKCGSVLDPKVREQAERKRLHCEAQVPEPDKGLSETLFRLGKDLALSGMSEDLMRLHPNRVVQHAYRKYLLRPGTFEAWSAKHVGKPLRESAWFPHISSLAAHISTPQYMQAIDLLGILLATLNLTDVSGWLRDVYLKAQEDNDQSAYRFPEALAGFMNNEDAQTCLDASTDNSSKWHWRNAVSFGDQVTSFGKFDIRGGVAQYKLGWRPALMGSFEFFQHLCQQVLSHIEMVPGEPCGGALYQMVPKPRRYPLATYIQRHAKDLFDFLVIDEAHEYSNRGSAQERAVHRLTEMGKPTFMLTGTSSNGYASSLFANTWSISHKFRKEFAHDEVNDFVNRYGYRKVLQENEDKGEPIPPDYGSMTDRVSLSLKERVVGEAPGVHPLYIFKHLLPESLVVHKDDLDLDLAPLVEIPVPIEVAPNSELFRYYRHLERSLLDQIKEDFRDEELSGKLWGQMAQLPSYLDRCHNDTGNVDRDDTLREYAIHYPESVGGALVARADPFPVSLLTPKEEWLRKTVQKELGEGRPVMVFVWNTNSGLADRIGRILDPIAKTVVLDAQKVQASKRQKWINTHVIKKKRQVLIVNPKAVETGLNNLTYFPTAVWYQSPNCSPIIYSQANGRIHRPGQTSDEVRSYVPYYEGTSQEAQFNLLGRKVQASRQTDGLDITTALAAAGVGESDGVDAMTIGKALFEMLR